ncbi:hypothetical protein [Desulfosoma caldarium]|uniref:Uncharacterized protein n=1 Tax=Desulfosoma caldarium TaxID=610254 RepID=A0A3N1V1R8_9BACT|nr:hypothetical protein [Desulfosoma caldarium]ROQ93436.1 hypothetical protein EDC27_1453 [Desulfosoma caldarium]
MDVPVMSRVYVIFKRTRCCIRIYTDMDRHGFQSALEQAMKQRRSLFLHVYQPNGKGFYKSHTTVTPYEILVDCMFHVEEVNHNGEDPCTDKGKEARLLERLFKEHGLK